MMVKRPVGVFLSRSLGDGSHQCFLAVYGVISVEKQPQKINFPLRASQYQKKSQKHILVKKL